MAAAGAAALGWAALAAPTPALAQVDAAPGPSDQLQRREAQLRELQELELDTRLRANQSVPAGQRALLDYGAFVQLGYLSLEDPEGDTRILRTYEFVPYGRVSFDGAHEIFLRGRFGYRDFHRGDSFDGRGDEPIDGDLDRGFYRFDLQRYLAAYHGEVSDFNLTFQAGRDFNYWANGLVLAESLDGVILTVGNELLSFEAIAGRTPTRTVDFDASRPSFDHNTKRGFYGGMLTATLAGGEHRPFVYVLAQQDYNPDDFGLVGNIATRYEYNSYYVGAGSSGSIGDNLRYGVEFAYEFGDNLSNSFEILGLGGLIQATQEEEGIDAMALDVQLDYLLNDPRDTRLSAELILATGDDDRIHTSNTFGGSVRNTNDRAFNAFGLLNTGLAFAPEVSNIISFRLGAATLPLPDTGPLRRMQVGTDVFVFGKFEKDAPVDEFTGDERYLGWEPDVYLNWQVSSDVTLALRYGVFFPSGDAFVNDDSRQFFFAGLTFGF